MVLAEGIRLVRGREPRLQPVAKISQLPVGDVDGLERFGLAGRGDTNLAIEVLGLAVDRIDRDLEVGPGKHQLQVVACRLQEAAISEQVAAKGREPVAEWSVGPLEVKADIQLAGSGVEHRLTKRQPQLRELEAGRLELGDQRPLIDRLSPIESLHRADGRELPVDLRHPSANRGLGQVAYHAVEPVIAHESRMRRRKPEKAIDHLPLVRRPVRHARYVDFLGRRLRRRSACARMKV